MWLYYWGQRNDSQNFGKNPNKYPIRRKTFSNLIHHIGFRPVSVYDDFMEGLMRQPEFFLYVLKKELHT